VQVCGNCRRNGLLIPAAHVRAIKPSLNDAFTNSSEGGLWNSSQPQWVGPRQPVFPRYRVVNQTSKCTGPRLVVFESPLPPELDVGWAAMPAGWCDAEGVRLMISKGTLIPAVVAPASVVANAGGSSSSGSPRSSRRKRSRRGEAESPVDDGEGESAASGLAAAASGLAPPVGAVAVPLGSIGSVLNGAPPTFVPAQAAATAPAVAALANPFPLPVTRLDVNWPSCPQSSLTGGSSYRVADDPRGADLLPQQQYPPQAAVSQPFTPQLYQPAVSQSFTPQYQPPPQYQYQPPQHTYQPPPQYPPQLIQQRFQQQQQQVVQQQLALQQAQQIMGVQQRHLQHPHYPSQLPPPIPPHLIPTVDAEHDDVDDPLIQQPGGVSGTMPSLPFADAMPIAPPHLLGPPPGGPRGSSLSNMSPLEPNMLASQDGPSNTEDAFFGPL